MSPTNATPLPLFDAIEYIESNHLWDNEAIIYPNDFKVSLRFLQCYRGSQGTFNSYRREVERLLHWCWRVAECSVNQLKYHDIEDFIQFCQNPPHSWIGTKKVPRFIIKQGRRQPNTNWRPFVVTASKTQHRLNTDDLTFQDFELSQGAIKEIFAILSTYYNFLIQEEYTQANPVALIRQKSQFIRKSQGTPKIRRLTNLQWRYVFHTAQQLADADAQRHERTLFILSALFTMYLRISELVASSRWTPTMNDFFRDHDNNWWFVTVGKGNKERQIAVSDAMLNALKRWRRYLGRSSLPSPADNAPLLPKLRGKGPLTSTTYIREIVQLCFDKAAQALQQDGYKEESEQLQEATVHWLRHTGISEDVQTRPREHVRDDAGHGSSAITDRYIDIELKERHRSAKNKPIDDNK